MMRCLVAAACAAALVEAQRDPYSAYGRGAHDPLKMKNDMFDNLDRMGKGPGGKKKRPPCPKPDTRSPWGTVAFVEGEIFVKPDGFEECGLLLEIDGHNMTEVVAAAKVACGEGGHDWRMRLAEEPSVAWWSGGWDFNANEMEIKVMMLDGSNHTAKLELTEDKLRESKMCWMKGCGCEQAKVSIFTQIFFAIAAVVGMGFLIKDGMAMNAAADKKKAKKEKKEKKDKSEKKEKKEKKKKRADDESSAADDSQAGDRASSTAETPADSD